MNAMVALQALGVLLLVMVCVLKGSLFVCVVVVLSRYSFVYATWRWGGTYVEHVPYYL